MFMVSPNGLMVISHDDFIFFAESSAGHPWFCLHICDSNLCTIWKKKMKYFITAFF